MQKDKTNKALAYAYRLFSVRPRSERELRDRLFKKGFGRTTAHNVISLLKEKNVIDDAKFAELWIESRMHNNPKGDIVLRRELRDKGVSIPIIEEALSGKEEAEGTVARELAKQRLARLKNIPEVKAKKKIFDFLARKGFRFDVIEDVIQENFNA